MKAIAAKFSVVIISVLATLLFCEIALQVYVYQVAKKGKLFEPDEVTGWKNIPGLSLQRVSPSGGMWHIVTDVEGNRGLPINPNIHRNILITGDSFVFGEGVNVGDRFDSYIDGYAITNIGVMGFGTDQELLRSQSYIDKHDYDAVILITYINDFADISRRRFSGRAKPYYTYLEGELTLNLPNITIVEVLRDRSYLFSLLASFIEKQRNISEDKYIQVSGIYRELVLEFNKRLKSKGSKFIIAFHGVTSNPDINWQEMESIVLSVCHNKNIYCLNMDFIFTRKERPDLYFSDGHWNASGHKVAGNILDNFIRNTMGNSK